MNKLIGCVTLVVLAAPMSVLANSWSCTRNDHTREVVIDYPSGGSVPCSVVYKKPTEKVADQTLWSAENAEGYCEEKAEAFVAKLESWQWTCSKTMSGEEGSEPAGDSESTGEAAGESAASE